MSKRQSDPMSIKDAERTAGLWYVGKMIGGDEDAVRDTLLEEVRRLRLLVSETCADLRWYATRQVDLSEGQPYLESSDKGYRLAKDQQCWGDALLDEINELEWDVLGEEKSYCPSIPTSARVAARRPKSCVRWTTRRRIPPSVTTGMYQSTCSL